MKKLLGGAITLSLALIVSGCGSEKHKDLPQIYETETPALWTGDDSTVYTMTNLLLNREIDTLASMMPTLDGVDNMIWLDQNVSPLWLNLGPQSLLSGKVDYSVRYRLLEDELPMADVVGVYPTTTSGTLWFGYSYLYQDGTWKWSGMSFDHAKRLDIADYTRLKSSYIASLNKVRQALGSGALLQLYSELPVNEDNDISEDVFMNLFSYTDDAREYAGEIFDSMVVDTVQLREYDSLRAKDGTEIILVRGDYLTQGGVRVYAQLGFVLGDDGDYELYSVENYQRDMIK